ncbi:MAG TPA: trypsin-like peptidase domain-containing protein, partial [Vicinamibacteria bacterium]|nr:trypsin-like peptidase domain-containing protein [Vicinamibacteria bacterium]
EDMPRVPRQGAGSGVIIDRSGVILTNNHVVSGADEVIVHLQDGREFKATKIRTDKQTDLALVWINAGGSLPAAKLGDSDRLQIGDWVLAIGTPFGLEATVSSGIISAKGRHLRTVERTNFLQTDAAINPGNSGGPLVNMKAEVVGINSNIISNSGGSMGIGFAIPANMTRKVYDQLVTEGAVSRGWLGVSIQPLTPDLARSFGLAGQKGALVAELVGQESPARKAGLEVGDIIVEFDGEPVQSNTHLVHLVGDVKPGETVEIKYYRDGNLRTTHVTLDRRSFETEASAAPVELESDKGRLGISGQNLTEQLASEIGSTSRAGVLLVGVDPNGPADDAGLTRGDIVIEANRQTIRNVDDLQRILADVPSGGDLLLRIERVGGGQSSFLFVPVRLE